MQQTARCKHTCDRAQRLNWLTCSFSSMAPAHAALIDLKSCIFSCLNLINPAPITFITHCRTCDRRGGHWSQ